MIPKIIHQTDKRPSHNDVNRQTWINLNPTFEYKFADDTTIVDILQQHRPDLLSTYNRLPRGALKADLFRYVALHTFGGIYADADTICHVPVEEYLDFDQCDLVLSKISNWAVVHWVIAASKNHPLIGNAIEKLVELVDSKTDEQLAHGMNDAHFTMTLTGPCMFNNVVMPMCESMSGTIMLPENDWGLQLSGQNNPQLQPLMKVQHLFDNSWTPVVRRR